MAKEINTQKIRNYNLIAGFFHLVQMAVVLVLSSDFTLPIVARYAAGPPGSDFAEPVTLLNAPIGLTVAIFLGLSAFFHFLVASPQFFGRYSAGLAAHRNYFRWVEYSISSSVMIVLIALITGVSDVVAIICLFGVNASMILFGWLQEKYEQPGNGGWLRRAVGQVVVAPHTDLLIQARTVQEVPPRAAHHPHVRHAAVQANHATHFTGRWRLNGRFFRAAHLGRLHSPASHGGRSGG